MAAEKDLVIAEGSGKKKWLLLGGGAVLVVVLIVASLMFFGGSDSNDAAAASDSASDTAAAPGGTDAKGSALYVPLPRPFVFNVPGASRDRMVQIKVQLLVRGTNNETIAMRHIPLIEGTLLRIFSAATSEQLMTFEGKEKLRKDSLEECRRVLNDLVSSPVIEQVLFTGFVMQ